MHADLKDTARVRAAATFIGEQVERNKGLFMPLESTRVAS